MRENETVIFTKSEKQIYNISHNRDLKLSMENGNAKTNFLK